VSDLNHIMQCNDTQQRKGIPDVAELRCVREIARAIDFSMFDRFTVLVWRVDVLSSTNLAPKAR